MMPDTAIPTEAACRIELLGGMRVAREGQPLPPFKTRRMTLLLARLACFPNRVHPRDTLAEELWPDDHPDALRERFRQTLALLRRELEPPGVPSGSVLIADRSTVCLAPHSFSTDLADFEAAFRLAADPEFPLQVEVLRQAVSLYRGELLPGFYEDWIQSERGRLEELYRQALSRLTNALASVGQLEAAIEIAWQAVAVDALSEDAHCALIRLLAQTGRAGQAERQYAEMERLLREELDAAPTEAAKSLMTLVRAGVFAPLPAAVAPQTGTAPPAVVQTPSNPPALPVSLTRFFGREEEITQIMALLAPVCPLALSSLSSAALASASASSPLPAPLVTLTGPGGAGKTRLALETARRLSAAFEGAVWFVPLADVSRPELIENAIAETLSLPRSPQSEPLKQVVEHLQAYPAVLLILDNFEHLQETGQEQERGSRQETGWKAEIGQGTAFVQTLRRHLPHLSCLITSRQKLNLEGERDIALPPLTTPDTPQTPEQLLAYPGIQLFLDRAQAARYSFALTHDNAPAVSLLNQRLEGLPLAIELAAAWAATLTPEQILQRLSRRFDLLVSRRKDVPARHQSLQAVLEGSYQQLPPKLQRLYAHLSVFRGGWTLEASERIAGVAVYGDDDCFQVMDGLALLQERSFLQAEERGEAMRYRMLESLREFGAEQLEAEERQALARRHAECFAALTEEAQRHLRAPEEKLWFDRLEAEQDNLRAALEWSVGSDVETALKMSALLGNFWLTRGMAREGVGWLQKALNRTEGTPVSRALALNYLALMNLGLGEYSEGAKQARKSLAALRVLGDQESMVKASNTLGSLLMEQGEYSEAQACYEECLRLCQAIGHQRSEATILANLGTIAFARGEYDLASTYYSRCLTARRALGDQRGIASALDYLGRSVREQGEYIRACALHSESLAMRRELNDKHSLAASLNHLGTVKIYLGEWKQARALLEESLAYGRELGDKGEMAGTLSELGELAYREQDQSTARALWLESLALLHEAGDNAGIASVLEALAGHAVSDEQRYRAAQMLGRADALRSEIFCPIRPSARPRCEQTLAAIRDALGEERFRQAYAEGQSLPLASAIQIACSPPM